MAAFTGYSLWLMPEGQSSEDLSSLIKGVSQEHGARAFEPHVTLLPGVQTTAEEAVRVTQALASELKPFEIHLSDVASGDSFFQCVLARCTPDMAIMEANKQAEKAFAAFEFNKRAFVPHMSLLYSDMPEGARKEAAEKLNSDWKERSFLVDKIHVYDTNGPVDNWKCVGTIPL